MAVQPIWSVDTLQINVNQGDSALHVLQRSDGPGKPAYVEKLVLIDGGTEYKAYQLQDLLYNLGSLGYKGHPDDLDLGFLTSIVVTHWDADHLEGVCGFLERNIYQEVQAWLDLQKLPLGDQKMQDAIHKGEIKCPWIKYAKVSKKPTTVFYGPNLCWDKFSQGIWSMNGFEYEYWFDTQDGYCVYKLKIRYMYNGQQREIEAMVPWAILGPREGNLICYDLFSCSPTMPSQDAKSPQHVSKWLHSNNCGPAMICVAANGKYLCDPDGVLPRDKMVWIQKDKYRQLGLVMNPGDPDLEATGWSAVPFCEANINATNANYTTPPISVDAIMGGHTISNQQSIGLMVIWPDPNKAKVSHYFAGDLGYDIEERILRWSTVPHKLYPTMIRIRTKIQFIKLSHHGSKTSTPLMMLFAWKPRTIFCSNGSNLSDKLISWETLFYINVWALWRENFDSGQAPILFSTSVPGYMCRYWSKKLHKTIMPYRVGDSKNALIRSAGLPWRKMLRAMRRLGVPIESYRKVKDTEIKGIIRKICGTLYTQWNSFSGISFQHYAINCSGKIVSSEGVRLLNFATTYDESGVRYMVGDSITSLTTYNAASISGNSTSFGAHQRPQSSRSVNNKTRTNIQSGNQFFNPSGGFSSREAVEVTIMGSEYTLDSDSASDDDSPADDDSSDDDTDESQIKKVITRNEHTHLQIGSPEIRLDDDSSFYFMSSDAFFVDKSYPFANPTNSRNLNIFLGGLATGAFVLPAEPSLQKQSHTLHETDELSQWLSLVLEGADGAGCQIIVDFNNSLIESLQVSSKLAAVFKDARLPLAIPMAFSTLYNRHAFALKTLTWPVVDPEAPDIVGNAQTLCVSLDPESKIQNVEFTGQHIMSAAGFKSGIIEKVLTSLVKFTLNPKEGSKNCIWFSSDPLYTTTLRLCFIPSQKSEDALKILLDNVSNILSEVGIKLAINFEDPQVIMKRIWTKQSQPFKVENILIIRSWIKLEHKGQSLTFETAIEFEEESLSWILNFDSQNESDPAKDPATDQGQGKLSDLLKFLQDLFGLKDALPDLTEYLPGFDKIMIRRVIYTNFVSGSWSLKIDIQIVIASMTFLCSATVQDRTPKFSFFGALFPENRPGENGLGDTFNFLPFLPDRESWDDMSFIPTEKASAGSDVGRLGDLYGATDGRSGAVLPEAPFDLRMIRMYLRLDGKILGFGATIMSPAPEPTKYAVPPLRLGAASLDLAYDFGSKRIKKFVVQTRVLLNSPNSLDSASISGSVSFQGNGTVIIRSSRRSILDPEDSDYALIEKKNGIERKIADGTWVFEGSVFGLRGSLIYSLFDDDCNSEMIQLLENITLDLRIIYTYAGKLGTKFNIDGTLYLGKLKLHCFYHHYGQRDNKSTWEFGADLAVTGQKSDLLSVIESICGADLSKALPSCVKNVEVAPDQNKSLTSLKLAQKEDWFVVYIRIQLTDNTSIALYQIQRKSKTKDAEASPTKRVIVLQLAALPKVEGVPVIGDISLPFTRIQFMFVSSNKDTEEGLTEEEVEVLNENKPDGFTSIIFKSNAKKSGEKGTETRESVKAVLSNGFHFMILDEEKALLDHLFGRPKPKGEVEILDENVGADDQGLTPFIKKLGPVTTSAIGMKFDMNTQTLTFLVSASVKLGPLEVDLIGFGISFKFGPESTLRDLSGLTVAFELAGLGLTFTKNPFFLAGYLEHSKSDDLEVFQGGATIGFDPWVFQGGGYYAKKKKGKTACAAEEEFFKCFIAYASLSGPLATMGYAEIREVTGGLGYNTSLTFPTMEDIMDFPFISDKPGNPSSAVQTLFSEKWMTLKEGSNWVAAGLTVLAFQMLTVRAVVVVEWDRSVKLGLFGLATAEIPKQLENKFAKVQLGIAATIDFDAGIMKIDGQLTPASFILHPSCHLTGGFALYSWFGNRNGVNQGDWVFSIGGYHSLFQAPPHYPVPPRLGISWSYDKNINITGEAYFAITPKVCMGGGRLHITFTLGTLYAYFDAYADFLINYKPFSYKSQGGISVGVKYTLDLWLVSLPISLDLGAHLYLEGNPLSGKVRVDFWVFGFDVHFGASPSPPAALSGAEFWDLVCQADTSTTTLLSTQTEEAVAHIFTCTSGLIPTKEGSSTPSGAPWTVRGSIFAFTVSFKFPVRTAHVTTKAIDDTIIGKEPVRNKSAETGIYAKPMQLTTPMSKSDVTVTILPINNQAFANKVIDTESLGWVAAEAVYTPLPTALWGLYNEKTDPAAKASNNNPSLLNGKDVGTVELMTGITLRAPAAVRSKDEIPRFEPGKAMQEVVAEGRFVEPRPAEKSWGPGKTGMQYEEVRNVWVEKEGRAKEVTRLWEELGCFDWVTNVEDDKQRKELNCEKPRRLVENLEGFLVESPILNIK